MGRSSLKAAGMDIIVIYLCLIASATCSLSGQLLSVTPQSLTDAQPVTEPCAETPAGLEKMEAVDQPRLSFTFGPVLYFNHYAPC